MGYHSVIRLFVTCSLALVLFVVALTAPIWFQPRIDAFRWLAYSDHKPAAAPPQADLQPLYDELDVCLARTERLRFTLEALIPLWPGRGALPEMPGGWPKVGIGRVWKKDGWEVTK